MSDGEKEELALLKNIRGFLLKRRKSPLKGWHKVSVSLKRLGTTHLFSRYNCTAAMSDV